MVSELSEELLHSCRHSLLQQGQDERRAKCSCSCVTTQRAHIRQHLKSFWSYLLWWFRHSAAEEQSSHDLQINDTYFKKDYTVVRRLVVQKLELLGQDTKRFIEHLISSRHLNTIYSAFIPLELIDVFL